MSEYLSKKLSFLSFWLMVGVVILHSMTINDDSLSSFFQKYISQYLLQIIVPIFMFISGYLFFLSVENGSLDVFIRKFRQRFKTLFIPYIFWSLLIFIVVYLIQLIPLFAPFFRQKFFEMNSNQLIMQAIVYPYNYPLWFIRELMVYILLTPLIYVLLKKWLGIPVLTILFFLGFFLRNFIDYPIELLKIYPLFYFLLGCYFGIRKSALKFSFSIWTLMLFGVLFFGLNLFSLLFDYTEIFKKDIFEWIYFLFYDLKNLFGLCFIWILYDFLSPSDKGVQTKNYFAFSFFIFVFHGIPVTMMVKVIQSLGLNNFLNMFFYFIIPIFTIISSVYIAKVFKKISPKLYNFTTGSR